MTDDGNGTTFSFAPQETGPGIHIISYTINGVPAKKGIQVLAVPDVSLTLPGPITVNDTPVILTGGMPGGGIYSGIGISGDSFDPMEAGLGTHTITYTYTDANGCSGIASGTITVKNPPPPDNFCDGANDINSLFGQAYNTPQASGLWDNTEYTSDGDPAMGYECFDDEGLQHTIWYTFTGDGNTYSIRTVQCNAVNYINEGETQVAVYSGDCDNLTAVACNEDESTSTGLFNIYLELPTEIGVNYLMMIDGFEEPGFIADGEFCLEITNLTPDAVTDIQRTSIHIFPNPTEGKLSLNGVEAYRVDIHDWLGRKVAKFEQPVGELDISNLPAGVYLLRIDTKNGTKYSARVVKNK
ncbi:MAG: T9SS type A sorting domain-containing protein [Saprospirales bacterium]|nr:T9SS type A sorting domain-containing protein [Saprospirales bacterium]